MSWIVRHVVWAFQTGNSALSSGLCEVFHFLNVLQSIHLQRDMDEVKHMFDNLESGMKKVFEGLKKIRHLRPEVENLQRKLQCKWEFIRKKYLEYIKTTEPVCLLRVEASATPFVEDLKELLQFTCFDNKVLAVGRDAVLAVASTVKHRLSDFSSFLKVKALRNFTLGSYPLVTLSFTSNTSLLLNGYECIQCPLHYPCAAYLVFGLSIYFFYYLSNLLIVCKTIPLHSVTFCWGTV
jgi:hypothetical protein